MPVRPACLLAALAVALTVAASPARASSLPPHGVYDAPLITTDHRLARATPLAQPIGPDTG
jgi:hypothetical protein